MQESAQEIENAEVPATSQPLGSDTGRNDPLPTAVVSATEGALDRRLPENVISEHIRNPSPPDTHSDDPAIAVPVGETTDESRAGTFLWLRRADQLFVGLLLIAMLTLMIIHWVRLSHWGMQPVEIERLEANTYQYRIDINTATWVEWMQLDGIGPRLAQRIVEDREKKGRFQTIDDLQRVKGIGPKTIERIRPWLTIEQP